MEGVIFVLYESQYFGICNLGETITHHGIKGMKWGVRRYQNPDGSLTAEGKKRYGTRFQTAQKHVKSRLSNKYTKLKREKIDFKTVKERGNLSDREAEQCSEMAERIYDKAFEVEPKITKDVVSTIESVGGSMYGLEHRLKQPTSIAAKIGSDAKNKGLSFKSSAGGISDVIRYTSVSDDKNFVSNYTDVKQKLLNKGYTEVRCKNYFDLYDKGIVKHKSVQSVFKYKDGNTFEIQFQTPSSQAAKDLKIPLYEEVRKSGTSDKRKAEIEKEMTNLAEHVNNPSGVFKIKSH